MSGPTPVVIELMLLAINISLVIGLDNIANAIRESKSKSE